MSRADRAINSEVGDWGYSEDAGERAWLLQSPSVDSIQLPNQSDDRREGTSTLGAVFIVVNAALGAGLLNFPAAFNMAGGVTAGVTLQMCMMVFIITGLVILAYCSQVPGRIHHGIQSVTSPARALPSLSPRLYTQ